MSNNEGPHHNLQDSYNRSNLMLKQIMLISCQPVYVNTDAVALIKEHPCNSSMSQITLMCGDKLNVKGDHDSWARRLSNAQYPVTISQEPT